MADPKPQESATEEEVMDYVFVSFVYGVSIFLGEDFKDSPACPDGFARFGNSSQYERDYRTSPVFVNHRVPKLGVFRTRDAELGAHLLEMIHQGKIPFIQQYDPNSTVYELCSDPNGNATGITMGVQPQGV